MINEYRNLSQEDKNTINKLFKKLDFNDDGKICVSDLTVLLNMDYKIGNMENKGAFIKNFLARAGSSSEGHITFQQFVNYFIEHDKKLELAFKEFDTNSEGSIDMFKIQKTFERLGMHIDNDEAQRLLKKVKTSGRWKIDYNEWREFLLLHPASDLTDIFKYWRFDIYLDGGADAAIGIPEDFSQIEQKSGSQFYQLMAGAMAGIVSRTCTAPLDRLKVMRQVHGYKHKGSDFLDAYRYMLEEGGLVSLWRGNGINVLKMAPETGIKYYSYERYKRLLTTSSDHPEGCWFGDLLESKPMLSKFLAGSLAGSTAQTIIYPLEVLKTRMCLRKTGQFHSIFECARFVYSESGFRGFYRGYFINLIGIIPYAGIELATYDRLRGLYVKRFMATEEPRDYPQFPPFYVSPAIAGFASACGIIVTYPAALMRAKLQSTTFWSNERRRVNALDLLKTILQKDGYLGLYRGLGVNLIKVLPAGAISFTTYEAMRREMGLGPLGSGT